MILNEQHTPVLIVGAGPSGLMMAAQLLRYGIQPIIIDSKQGPTDESKALAVQARSLEIYRQMGLIDRVLEGGKAAEGLSFNLDGKKAASLSFNNVGEGQTAFPFIHLYQQSKNEKLLLDFLTRHVCPVYWETNLMSLKQTEKCVEVNLQNAGQAITLTCDWVIGADGAHSSVRKQLNIPFSGDTYAHGFYLADVELLNEEINDGYVHLCLGGQGFSGFFPMPEFTRYRVIGNLPAKLEKKEGLRLEEVLPYLQNISGIQVNVKNNYWFTTYRLHHRMADKFREQRCFLIGDAAHIHSPVGGQGMNTGLQDAYNLAWKLAGVVNGRLKHPILDSYAAERMPVAKTLLNTTDRVFNIVMSNKWYSRVFKTWLMPSVLKFAWNNKGIREALFKRVSQIDISYRDSAINLQISQSTKVKAGDRLPYLKVFDEKKQEETDLHEWCSKAGFTFIVLGKLAESDLFTLAKWITQNYPATLNFFYLPPSAKNLHVFEAFEINPNRVKSLIVRPDMHIGFINDKVDMVLTDNYLRNIVGVM
ncbi:FAD-dependent monooxygenase [Mucilaginibacter gotjawali]|uniref:2-polyprenyl-6-methoxyphenol hydroxylase-like FAD-dependent oxidoreductase n=1 Tax=Mucilaginibacter gotjawali TaxID=1550579 RepID=A0A839S8I4_9SPHI|nr:FAD-dependent monooxygenase [Mucilaginibacter gotjawali]MBB3054441.1 2-polyprenyl-6-methoxyphenol hydroxylase-like FAD-dependent oxidoreductase [Mucilaginibacter gotjawali]